MLIPDNEIGGARVERPFTLRGEMQRKGTEFSADQVLAIPIANRRALVDAGFLMLRSKMASRPRERFIVATGKDRHDVIEGERINKKPLAREEAERLAHSQQVD